MTWPVRWDHLPLARATVDRAAARRGDPGLVDALRGSHGSLVVAVHRGLVATEGAELVLLPAATVAPLPTESFAFLGTGDGTDYLVALLPDELPDALTATVASVTWSHLREVGAHLSDRDAGLAATAVALAAWHDSHQFCPRCGAPTTPTAAGWQRRCARDGTEIHPRTDPAVIVAVTDSDDNVLLGHAAHWPTGRFSTLAGFVEPGESAEQALRREVGEEARIVVGEVTYRGSQTWPFPASLMLGFHARAVTTEIAVDGVEITEARWFSRAQLAGAVRSGEVLLPMRSSIARALIEDWFGGEVEA